MLDHHIQRSIVYRLALSEGLRFSELKPDTLDNKLFMYHLKKVISTKLVVKNDDGLYQLTPEGRRLGTRVLDSQQALVDHADSVLFLVVRRRSDNAWLLYRRKTHPLINRVGFMHATPTAMTSSEKVAAKALYEATCLKGTFRALGGGYFKVYDQDSLESFTHFTLMICEDATGELVQNNDYAEYFWENEPDFSNASMLPNMETLVGLYQQDAPFFIEKTFRI